MFNEYIGKIGGRGEVNLDGHVKARSPELVGHFHDLGFNPKSRGRPSKDSTLRCMSHLTTKTSVGRELGVEKPVHKLRPESRAEKAS